MNRSRFSIFHGIPFAMLCASLLMACCDSSKIPELTRGLYSMHAKDRNDAALALARCGKDAEPAVARLSQLLYDENVGVQSAASYALRKIDSPRGNKVLADIEQRRRDRKNE